MPQRKRNGFFDSKVTYHRDVGKERRELKREAMADRKERLAVKQLRAKELKAEADIKAAQRKIDAAESKVAAAEKKTDKGSMAETQFEAIKARMAREIEKQEEFKRAAQSKVNPAWGFGVFETGGGVGGNRQLAHFKSKAAAETWARSHGIEDYKIRRSFEKDRDNPRNPEDSAAALSESWHGRPAKLATDYNEKFRYHGVLTDLGRLQEISVMVTDRKAQAILFDPKTRLASSENGKQLYVVGGDQSLDLGALGITGEEAEKDLIPIGEVHHLVYETAKQHLGKADKMRGPYEHKLGEESGVMPILMYDRLNEKVEFAGGNYHIDATDYDGSHSAGLRD